jgi:CoA:oxalate CoA-transferase
VTMGWVISNFLIAGTVPQPHGNSNFTAAPSGAFRTGDGLLNIAANKQEQFEALARAVGREELINDPRFAKRECRKSNRAALTDVLETALSAKPAREWEALFNEVGVPAGCVVTIPEALQSPQLAERDLLQTFAEVPGVERPVTVVRAGFKLSGGQPTAATPPPRLGEHTDEVLSGLGYSSEEIESLRKAGAL